MMATEQEGDYAEADMLRMDSPTPESPDGDLELESP